MREHLPLALVAPGSDPVAAAHDVVRRRDEAWSAALRDLTGRPEITCASTRHGGTLHVTVSADIDPEDDETVGQLSTRAYDVVRNHLPSGITSVGVGIAGLRSTLTAAATAAAAP